MYIMECCVYNWNISFKFIQNENKNERTERKDTCKCSKHSESKSKRVSRFLCYQTFEINKWVTWDTV